MLGNMIGGFITIVVGTSLVGPVANTVADARFINGTSAHGSTNVTGAASTILGLTVLFFALAIVTAGIALTAQGLRAAGLLGI
jgi:uncharacterized membrane protein YhaH (DUF805 family)